MSRNGRPLEALLRADAEGRLHHAYLLAGPEGPAKLECVQAFASRLAEKADAAAVLGRIRRGQHPDFLKIEPVDGLIGVDQIRELPRALAFAPLESSRRVVLIEGAEGMNAQAANALLKVLEEPPGHTMFFLLCREPGELLPTIVSRCQALRFAPLSSEEMKDVTGERGGAEREWLEAWADGSAARAEFFLATEGADGLAREACEQLLALWEASPRIPSAPVRWVEGVDSEASCRIVLDSWELLLRDLAFTAAGAAEKMRFREFGPRLAALVGEAPQLQLVEEAVERGGALNRFRVYRELNGNLRLDFAALLVELQVFSVGKAR